MRKTTRGGELRWAVGEFIVNVISLEEASAPAPRRDGKSDQLSQVRVHVRN